MDVSGIRFPYKMEKTVYFVEDNILRIKYKLTNLSNFSFNFMWAAHPMFVLEEGSEIILPNAISKIISTLSFSGRLGRYGDEHNWPFLKSKNGKPKRLDIIRSRKVKDAEKYFIKGKMPEGWCALKYSKSKIILALSFPTEIVPYLSILPNEGGWDNLYNIFIEPCTASFDRLDIARVRGEYSSINPKSKISWYLNLTISKANSFKKINSKGYLI